MAEISVIVPVYNVERYLRRCIDSILGQTFHNIEVILVDDGSTDKSGRICDEYADQDARVVVIHKENGGPSDARNHGIGRSTGEYIACVDSDDYIDRRYLEILYRVIREKDADLVLCNNTGVGEEDIPEIKKFDYKKIVSDAVVVSKAEAYKRTLLDRETSITAWGKLYHRKLFQSVRYPKGEIYEDLKVIDQIIESSREIVYIPYTGYFYRVRRGSITHGKITPEHMTSVSNAGHLLKLMREKYPEAEKSAKINYTLQCFRMASALMDQPEYMEKCQWFRKEILKEGREFFASNYTDFGTKCSLICLGMGIPFYKIMRKFYYRMEKIITQWNVPFEEFLFTILLNGAEQERYRHYRLLYGKVKTFLKAKINRNKIWLEKLELPVTTCCTLCCRNCANLLQYYETPSHVSVEQLKENLSAVLSAVEGVRFLRILGGEPLLHPDLYEILKFCIKECHAVEEIQIITNGTLLFHDDVIELMKKHPEFQVQISDYGVNSSKLQLLVKQLNDVEIRNVVGRPEWKAKADLHRRKRSKCSNTRLFRQCSRYVSLLNDELHVCPRSCHGTNLQAIPKEERDYVNVAQYKENKAALKAAIIRMLEQPYVEACKYCSGDGRAADRLETVPAGEQCSRREARTCFQEMVKEK